MRRFGYLLAAIILITSVPLPGAVVVSPADTAAQSATTAITTDDLNLRTGPAITYSAITVIPAGSQVMLTGQNINGYRSVIFNAQDGWVFADYLGPAVSLAFASSNPIEGPTRGSVEEALELAIAAESFHLEDVELYIVEMYRLAPQVGFDPAILVAQSALETGNWRSYWWFVRLNPAGIGITGSPAQEAASPTFPNGAIAARAQIAHMHAEVYGSSRPLPPILQGVDPTYQRVFSAGWAGTIRTIEDLTGTWAVDPEYHTKVARKANLMFGDGSTGLVIEFVAILRAILQQLL